LRILVKRLNAISWLFLFLWKNEQFFPSFTTFVHQLLSYQPLKMKKNTSLRLCFLSLMLLLNPFSSSIFAQINSIAGYNYTRNNPTVLNQIIDSYNARNPTLSQPMSHLSALNGMNLGVRYRFPYAAIEFVWSTRIARAKDQVVNADRTSYQNIINLRNQVFSLGGDFHYGAMGIGGTFDLNQIQVRKERSTDATREVLMNNSMLTNHIYLIFDVKVTEGMSISVRPYIQLAAKNVNFYEVEKKFNPDIAAIANPDNYNHRFFNYGISFSFINGSKRD
jgi:hypothetical protein